MTVAQPSRSLPPGPKGRPFVGHLFEFRRDPIQFLTRLAREHGDVARFSLAGRMFVQISEPELIRDVLVTNHRNFRKTGFLERARPLLGDGLVTADGELHRRQRRLMQPSLNKQRVAAYADLFVALADEHSQRWHDGHKVDMFQEMLHLTMRIVTRALFSNDLNADASRIEESLSTVINHVTWLVSPLAGLLARLPLAANRRFQGAVKELDTIVYRMIEERRQNPGKRDDVLSALLWAQDVEGDGNPHGRATP
jgi:cytochrome P450